MFARRRIVYGARISLKVGVIAAGLGVTTGLIIGLVCGYIGGAGPEGRDARGGGAAADNLPPAPLPQGRGSLTQPW
jgi:hypothetical protein